MPGEFITCPDCQGWPSCETGMLCLTCGDDGQIWEEYPDPTELECFLETLSNGDSSSVTDTK